MILDLYEEPSAGSVRQSRSLSGQVFVVLHNFTDSIQPGESSEAGVGERQVDFGHPAIDGALNSVRHLFRNDPDHVTV